MLAILRETWREFRADDAPRVAAALAYYTIFALPPLLVLLIMIAGAVWEPEDIQGSIQTQMRSMLGAEGAAGIRTMLENANRPGRGGLLPTLLSVAALLFGATGALTQLQSALNTAWDVRPDPERGGVRNFLAKRLLSLGMILGIGFLLLVSLVLSAALTAFGDALAGLLPDAISGALLHAVQLVVSFVVITGLFAAMFKVLPDAVIQWRDVWAGAVATAALFVIGKFAIGLYIGQSEPGSAYGAAGSLAVILVWVYYAALIVLLGAEFTQVWARRRGAAIVPEPGAVRIG
ncbi:MAG TPA: YihY/virulence factor BrkB family protein [Longimicrobiales bacterium]|nr:YihY/virulence factor BrkB family protein [Longimicrobiales bacterium]